MKSNKRTFYVLLQLIGALIWGLAFAFQSIGMEETGPFTFTAVRFMLAAAVVFVFSLFYGRRKVKSEGNSDKKIPGNEIRGKENPVKEVQGEKIRGKGIRDGQTQQGLKDTGWRSAHLWKAGIICGVFLSLASNLQQFGILYTYSVGKAGFITAMYIVLVPIFGLFLKKKAGLPAWIGVAIAVAGLYFLSVSEKMSFEKGDPFLLACAVVFSLQILAVDRYSGELDGVKLACIEFLTVSLTSAVPMLLLEAPSLRSIAAAAVPILYAGALSGGVAYTIQIICQSRLEPYTASILMSCEALFSVLGGFVILHQMLTPREITGCILMFAAIMTVQIFPGSGKD